MNSEMSRSNKRGGLTPLAERIELCEGEVIHVAIGSFEGGGHILTDQRYLVIEAPDRGGSGLA